MRHTDNPGGKGKKCLCPYCEEKIGTEIPPFCRPCGITLHYCITCGTVADKEATVCPKCGGSLSEK